MKHNNLIAIFILCIWSNFSALAQSSITQELNAPRAGDCITKQQVEYKDPGRAGENVIWDFGQLNTVNKEYKLVYMEPRQRRDSSYILGCDTFKVADGLVVGREHFTNYFYRQQDSVLYLLGYENHVDRMHYETPLPVTKFPFHYGEAIEIPIKSENLFSQQVTMNTYGSFAMGVDALGMLVLPKGDTLKQVLRTRSVQMQFADSVPTMDSIQVNTTIETCKFYARGYRYPVFETVKTLHKYFTLPLDSLGEKVEDSPLVEVVDTFLTAFIYPPPQQYSENPDTANIAELERMTAEEDSTTIDDYISPQDPWAGMYYNVSPNPTHSNVLFEIYLPRSATSVMFRINNQLGVPMITQNKGSLPEGISSFTINMYALPVGNYVLDFWLDGYLVHGGVIMRR